jgi:hypothetical protein
MVRVQDIAQAWGVRMGLLISRQVETFASAAKMLEWWPLHIIAYNGNHYGGIPDNSKPTRSGHESLKIPLSFTREASTANLKHAGTDSNSRIAADGASGNPCCKS